MTSPYDIGEVTVWVKDANAETGAFSWGMPWRIEKRLIPTRSLMALSGSGDATFRLLRAYRNDDVRDVYDTGAVAGSYIAITPDRDPPTDDDPATTENALWFGYITGRDFTTMAIDDAYQPNADEIGTVTARCLGDLMDRVLVSGFRQQEATGNPLGEAMRTAPIANLTISLGQVIGNRTDVTLDGALMPLFTRLPADMAQPAAAASGFWTRGGLLKHLLRFCVPAGLPTMTVDAIVPAILTSDLEYDERVTFDLSGVTLKGAIDLLVPRSRGLVWSLWPRGTTWKIFVDSLAAADITSLHANTLRTVDTTAADLTTVDISEQVPYDQVIIRGAPHVFCFTASIADGNMEKGWSTTQETRYLAGASKHSDGTTNTTYSSLTNPQKLQANREIRQNLYGDVFTRMLVKPTATGEVQHRGSGSGTGSGTLANAFPTVTWAAGATSVATDALATTDETPYLPCARIMRTIPWQEGRASGGANTSDLRAVETKLRPRYMHPRVFRYVSADTYKWTDLLAAGDAQPGPQVDVDDRSAALRVAYTPPELLAKGSWATASPVPTTPYSVTPDSDATASDYRKLVFTIAMESDQRLEVSQLRSGVTAAAVRRPLILEDCKLQFWYMHAGTIIGIRPDRTPDRLLAAVKVRDDYAAAQVWLEQTAAFALATSVPAVITVAHPDIRHTWAEVGELIHEQVDRAPPQPDQEGKILGTRTLNSTVESVERIYAAEDGGTPRLIVRTMVADPPARMGGGAVSPVGGGAVSLQLGGTGPQATFAAATKAARSERDAQRAMVVPPKPIGSTAHVYRLVIVQGNTLATGQLGVKFSASTITNVATAYDPATPATAIDGVGWAEYFIDGASQGYVLVLNDGGGGSAIDYDVVGETEPDVCSPVSTTASVTVGGDPNTTLTMYRIDSLVG